MSQGGPRADEGGMMILLGAILLVAAFLTLAVVLGRVSDVQDAVSRDFDEALTAEAESVAIGVRSISATMADSATYCADLASALDQVKSSVANRGYLMWYTVTTCTDFDDPLAVEFGLTDGASEVTLTVERP